MRLFLLIKSLENTAHSSLDNQMVLQRIAACFPIKFESYGKNIRK